MSVMTNDPEDEVRELQRALYRAAKRSATRRFHALYDKVHRKDILWRAWELVKANRGSAGVDGATIEAIEESGVNAFLNQLEEALQEGTYRPLPVRRQYIVKRDGRKRPLGIPAVRDRVVQAAMKIVVEPIFEADFQPCSFGFRPKRSAHDANEVIRRTANRGYNWVVDADIENYFDTINQKKLMEMVEKRISDRRLLKLIRKFLKSGIFEGGRVHEMSTGTPQGGVLSPLLANIYLNYLDILWEKHCKRIGVLVRYADDAVILCGNQSLAMEAWRRLQKVMERLELKLHSGKTRLVNLTGKEAGFDFLGFHHRKVKSWRTGHHRLLHWPSQRAMKALRQKIRDHTAHPKHLTRSLQEIIEKLNPILKGWGNYFRVGNSGKKFGMMDHYIQERLFLYLSKKHHKSGRGWKQRWQHVNFYAEGLHQLSGTVRWYQSAQATG